MDQENSKEKSDISSSYKHGKNPEIDAWHTAFYIENHLDYYSYKEHVASPEQVRFMVYLDENDHYYPCSDEMFEAIINRNRSGFLQKKYNEVLQRVLELIDSNIDDDREKTYLESLVIIKYKHETRDEIMLPSRLEKRLLNIFYHRTQIDDPLRFKKAKRNRKVSEALESPEFKKALNHVDLTKLDDPPTTITDIRERVEELELKRLVALAVETPLWDSEDNRKYTENDYKKIFARALTGNGVDKLFDFLGIHGKNNSRGTNISKKILWIADETGEIIIDITIAKYLVKLGHTVIIGVKGGPFFTKVAYTDTQEDEIISKKLEGAYFIDEKSLNKNDLVGILRSDDHIYVISDETQEKTNLLLTSVSYARIFKEVDGIISRGNDQKRRFFNTGFEFTQNIFNISKGDDDSVLISFKPRHPSVINFSHKDLEKKAKTIIDQMKDANENGMTVVFYSGVIGSIPGKIDEAKEIMSVFIQHLKKQFEDTFIINPSHYYEPGMDADDLMYMWEIVQTSSYIDIWRFQTYEDIATSFQIMDKKVPPEWVGKDATYSTGCTKEMIIAQIVQKKNPEMQIIGPAKSKFMRRLDYGVGKMYDERL
ncbi:MAG: hypothetical protein HN737_10970 [Desulfobacterales bacterium]|jgi:uncharacterized protein with ATP-grasp and redox domains|nr:hypothetical protein [Desulfobacteraceae bacterium]MBT4363540.1 hypothetical protein [Desulfobacteraceae bacterium]MBT7084759.1 hypothetical protein [Desulfobacterales bacterium]MBT7697917.1 hypothetical protein [Desulfobacterales bacterium]